MNPESNSITPVQRPHNPARFGHIAVRVVFLVLASVSVLGAAGWSTHSLYELMAANAAKGAAILACGVLDMAWIASLAMTAADVYGGDWQSEFWSWGTLVASALVAAMYGWQVHSWPAGVLGVLFTLASKGLTQSFLRTLRPKLSKMDRNRLKHMDYQRRVAELERQKRAELLNDEFRWGSEPGSTQFDNEMTLELPASDTRTQLERLRNHPEPRKLSVPLPLPPVQVPLPPVPVPEPAPNPSVQVAEPPSDRAGRVKHLAEEIGKRGGQINSVTLSEVIETYGLKPTAKATASTLRKDAHSHWLNHAPGTGNFI